MDLSLVIPVKEESENLPELFKEIVAAIEPTGFTYEVILIDDGSRDNTWEVVESLSKEYSFIRAFRFLQDVFTHRIHEPLISRHLSVWNPKRYSFFS